MASAVATPLENAFATIPGLDTMTSSSEQGRARITLQFRLERNIDAAGQDVQAAIAGATPQAASRDAQSADLQQGRSVGSADLFRIAVLEESAHLQSGPVRPKRARSQLSTLDGVAQVNIFGGAKYAVRIQADPNALAARQMGINDLATAATHQYQSGDGHAERRVESAVITRRRPADQCQPSAARSSAFATAHRSRSAMSPMSSTASKTSVVRTG